MNNIQKYIVLLLTVMLLVPDSAWAQESKQEFVIKGVVEDNLGPVAGASIAVSYTHLVDNSNLDCVPTSVLT